MKILNSIKYYSKDILRQIGTLLLVVFLYANAQAQIYPVQVMPQLIAPYTASVPDYYSGTNEKFVVLLVNTDLTKPSLQVRLKLTIQGAGVVLTSRDDVYYPALELDAGVAQRVSLNDLAPYFDANNLIFQGMTRAQYQQTRRLNEGFYQFCVEAYEYNTNRLVGRSNCAMAWISLLDPPFLNLPRTSESIAYRDPTNIIFQWTPRNLSSPTAAFNTEYEFTLVELWDNGIAPEAAFSSTQPLYRTTTQTSTLLYGPSEPLLIPGKRYGWRIKAQASDGSQNSDAYKNNGYSEIYWFTYQRNCPEPFNVQCDVSGGRATITWNANAQQNRYSVDYREKNQSGSTWYTVNSTTNRVMLYDLKKDKQYEYRVGGFCDLADGSFPQNGAVYTDIRNFTLNGSSKDDALACGILQPELKIANRTSIQSLISGEIITAGDFPVKLISVQGSNGNFTGNGYVTVPMLGKAAVTVRFSNINVNTDKQLIGGLIETTYDSTEKQIVDPSAIFDGITGDPASVAILRDLKDHIPDAATAPVSELIDFAKKLNEVGLATIDNTLVLSSAEKQQLKNDMAAMADATKTLENPDATPEQKKQAEQQLRNAVEDAGPIVQKLGEGVGRGLPRIVGNLFKNVRDFLNGYKGTEEDKQQAKVYTNQTDSITHAYLQRTDVPDSLKEGLRKAAQDAAPAWIALQNATVCGNDVISYNFYKSHGPNAENNLAADYSCYTRLGNVQWDWIDMMKAWDAAVKRGLIIIIKTTESNGKVKEERKDTQKMANEEYFQYKKAIWNGFQLCDKKGMSEWIEGYTEYVQGNNCTYKNDFYGVHTGLLLIEATGSTPAYKIHYYKDPLQYYIQSKAQQNSRNVLVFVNGYRKNIPFEFHETDNSIQLSSKNDYWEGIDMLFLDRLKDRKVYYADGHHSVETSNHKGQANFLKSMASSGCAAGDKTVIASTTGVNMITAIECAGCFHQNRCVSLNTVANIEGFTKRRNNGKTAGGNLLKELTDAHFDKKEEKIDIVAHSMGYAYALGIIDMLKQNGYTIARFYFLAPENAGSGGINWDDIQEEYWQYGTNEVDLKDKKWLQDGVAPQTGAFGLPAGKRAYIPEDGSVPQGFVESHSIGNYKWIFTRKEKQSGYVTPRK